MSYLPRYLYLFLSVALLLCCPRGIASIQDEIPIQRIEAGKSYPVHEGAGVYVERSNALSIEDVTHPDFAPNFRLHGEGMPNFGLSEHSVWITLRVHYEDRYAHRYGYDNDERRWYLEVGRGLTQLVELYEETTDGQIHKRALDITDGYAGKEIHHDNGVFPVTFLPGETKTMYLKVNNRNGTLFFPITLWEPDAFVLKVSSEEFLYGIFYGGMVLLTFYNFFIWLSIKDDSYLDYVGYLVFATLFIYLEMGHGLVYIPWADLLWLKPFIIFFAWMTMIYGLRFLRSFLNTQKNHGYMDKYIVILLRISVVSAILTLVRIDHITSTWMLYCSSVVLLSILCCGIYVWLQGNDIAGYFVLAWSCNMVGFFIHGLIAYQLLEVNAFTHYASVVGIYFEAILLSFALAYRIKVERNNKLASDRQVMDSMTKYRSIYDNAQEGMYQVSLSGELLQRNHAFSRMVGVNMGHKRLSEEDMARLFPQWHRLNQEGTHDEVMSKAIVLSQGTQVDNRWRIVDRGDDDDKVAIIEGTLIDRTEEYEKLRAVRVSLKERLSREMAVKTAAEKGRFIMTMSHEIRTPLSSIIGFSELLHDCADGAKHRIDDKAQRRQLISTVTDSSRQLLRTINNILDYSKIDAGKLTLESVPITLWDMTQHIMTQYTEIAAAKGVALRLHYVYPFPRTLKGDPTRLAQLLDNLVVNGVQYTHQGDVSLRLFWDADVLTCTVSDTGRGMEEAEIARLFSAYTKEITLAQEAQGAGLGLPIAKRLAVLMGGDIRVRSTPQKGSEFILTIPATSHTVDGNESAQWIHNDAGWRENAIGKKNTTNTQYAGTVLLAEDNVVNQTLIAKLLQRFGLTVIVAKDGVEACDLYHAHEPGLILMDINMPNRDGVEATTLLRQEGATVPIYALTAETDQAELQRIQQAGCEDVLSKPINKQSLAAVLSVCFGEEGA